MRKDKSCPVKSYCRDSCADCVHHKKYNTFRKKVKNLERSCAQMEAELRVYRSIDFSDAGIATERVYVCECGTITKPSAVGVDLCPGTVCQFLRRDYIGMLKMLEDTIESCDDLSYAVVLEVDQTPVGSQQHKQLSQGLFDEEFLSTHAYRDPKKICWSAYKVDGTIYINCLQQVMSGELSPVEGGLLHA